jgi:dTDP-4-dehydrorhamnose reductase
MVPIMEKTKKHIVVIGSSGMLGNTVTRYFFQKTGFSVTGTVRSKDSIDLLPQNLQGNIVWGIDVDCFDTVREFIREQQPDIVINCVGLVKQLSDANDPLTALPINSLFPHMLARFCAEYSARVVHMSTDCVFSGLKGRYLEDDVPDAYDLYGVSKRLGEVNYPNAVTLRTSIIGHELNGNRSLIDWFLSQEGSVKGFSEAVFSGLPTVEIARIIRNYVIPNEQLRGVYHVSAEPINKYDLLKLVANVYGHNTQIIKDTNLKIDRSLDSSRFRAVTGFKPAPWRKMITAMKEFG